MVNNIKYKVVLVGAFSLLLLSALVLADSSNDNAKLVNNVNQPITIERDALLAAYSYEDLNNYSDTVVMGTVKEILPPKWNTIDGKLPNKAPDEFDINDLIYTDVTISVDKYLKNSLSSNEVTVRVLGGKVGDDAMVTDEEPSFKPGEKVLLYLTKDNYEATKNISPQHFVVTGHMQGKFELTDNGKAVGWNESISQDELMSTIKE
ncbi:hypothetical protein [Methanosarcina sp.]|uniref:hypothetical protein n=1 Tax=Methanosarcina sp. TaxID=2213 RepID=UPI00298952BD|nr:hypothetical protein [Methanosarcina sp.]MDW5550716.1 hypothetical protein [Methanosarcina sp.]MDW5553250.1 hypothetical protein [Methanosarcina sp.]MDW5558286.1 hypothetical protein [Methanosarcina sp.]